MKIKPKTSLCIFRFATAFGFSKRMRFDLTINDFCYQLINKNKLDVYDPLTWRPYCHVKDFARAIEKFIFSPTNKIKNQIYNIGSNKNNFRKIDIIKIIKRHINKNIKINYLNYSKDKRNYIVNFDKAAKELKLNIKYSVSFGVKEIIDIIRKKKFNSKDIGNFNLKRSFINKF